MTTNAANEATDIAEQKAHKCIASKLMSQTSQHALLETTTTLLMFTELYRQSTNSTCAQWTQDASAHLSKPQWL